MNWTGDFCGTATVCRRVWGFHFQRGVARASSSEAPRMVEELERKWRRGSFMRGARKKKSRFLPTRSEPSVARRGGLGMTNVNQIVITQEFGCRDGAQHAAPLHKKEELSRCSFSGDLWEWMGDDAGAFFDGDDFVQWEIFEAIDLAAGPGDFEAVNLGVFAQAEENARVAGGHVAHAAFGLFD